MRKLFYNYDLVFLTLIIFLVSCSKNIESPELMDDLSIRNALSKAGFDTTDMVISGDIIIIEGDIALSLKELSKTTARQASSTPLFTLDQPILYNKVSSLTYFISPAIIGWQQAIDQAFNNYNNGSGRINFTRTTDINLADITVEEEPSSGFAYAQFPSNGNPGSYIRINGAATANLEHNQMVWLITHEIGHTIGFRHTNWRGTPNDPENIIIDGVTIGAYTIPGTPNSTDNPDPNSVFNSGANFVGVPTWSSFSIYDQIALRAMFPHFINGELEVFGTDNNTIIPPGTTIPAGTSISVRASVPYWRGNINYEEWDWNGLTRVRVFGGSTIAGVVENPSQLFIFCAMRNDYGEFVTVSY